jgi:hypothetical protein
MYPWQTCILPDLNAGYWHVNCEGVPEAIPSRGRNDSSQSLLRGVSGKRQSTLTRFTVRILLFLALCRWAVLNAQPTSNDP